MPDTPASESRNATVLLGAGFGAGVSITGLLNPVDRALFLSVSKRRSFLDPCNWRQPFQGLGQSLVGRAVSTGLWFPLERMAQDFFGRQGIAERSPTLASTAAGQTAGVMNALLLSPLQFIKYQTWGLPEGKRSFGRTALKIHRTAGVSIFFRGLPATMMRDALFGGCFSTTRHALRGRAAHAARDRELPVEPLQFGADFVAAGAATTLSAPFNYARNMQFSARLADPTPGTWPLLQHLLREARALPTLSARLGFLLRRNNVGWGTLRVAGGMALTAHLFAGFVAIGESLAPR